MGVGDENFMKENILTEFLVLSCQPDGGAYHYSITADGRLQENNKISISNPMWAEIHGGRLCVCFLGDDEARELSSNDTIEGYAEYSLVSGAMLEGVIPTCGNEVCHFVKDGREVYFANYGDGSICQKMAVGGTWVFGHTPSEIIPLGPDSMRQERPHVHQCILSPDKKFVLVCDLGLDCVFVYDRSLHEISHAKIPAGHGARHAVFSPDGERVYVIGEMAASLTEFSWQAGELTYVRTVEMRGEEKIVAPNEGAAAIAVSADGRHIYATDRGCDTIVHFLVSDEGLQRISCTSSGGRHPRDFKLIANGHLAVCCNQFGNCFTVFRVGCDGELTLHETWKLLSPLCVQEL